MFLCPLNLLSQNAKLKDLIVNPAYTSKRSMATSKNITVNFLYLHKLDIHALVVTAQQLETVFISAEEKLKSL
ncbi:11931_t:CDS:1, partial [Cetraspora pellucida]